MSQNKALSMIGLATKAGKVASGEFCTEKEVKSGRACLVIVADDASDNTKKKFHLDSYRRDIGYATPLRTRTY